MIRKLLPKSLTGQVLLTLAGALLMAQAISAALLYRAQSQYREEGLSHALALRITMAIRHQGDGPPTADRHGHEGGGPPVDDMPRAGRPEIVENFAPLSVDRLAPDTAERISRMLNDQDISPTQMLVVERPLAADPHWMERLDKRYAVLGKHRPPRPEKVLLAATQVDKGGPWFLVRVSVPPKDPWLLVTLIAQTLFIYAALVGAMALILRRIARPLAALTSRAAQFAETRDAAGQIEPQGPDDVRHLIEAINAMEQRITALISEKDVMLGAIGHDLKTPLAALRVRIECVEDDAERGKMAKTIEDIVHSLDDILSLARVGRPSDAVESTELSALIASIVEEYEDMDQAVSMEDMRRLALPLRGTWAKRALRNLIDNALRYGNSAVVSLQRESAEGRDWAVIRVEDAGKGIPEADIERMFAPFTRGEPSRNMATGGAGLGLTLARAIAQQHGGALNLTNRMDATGQIVGLVATLRLPVPK
jgi:signal transduction histidine kinase